MKTVRRILVVVDNLVDFKEVTPFFGELPPQWKVYFSQSKSDALTYLDQVQFDLVFVDLAAGPLAGAQFLHEVWARHPDIIRFLLGNSLDPDLMVTCVMGSHQFLQKPLLPSAVESALERADLMNSLLQDKDIQKVVSRIRTLPSRPRIYMEVIKELHSPSASAQTVGELVAKDMAISAKLIQMVNSASFGLSQQISTPTEAVFLLGMETTTSLILGIEAFASLDHAKPFYFAIDHVWRHSQAVAHTARRIAEIMCSDSSVAHRAFTAGLLHDIGKLALTMNLDEPYQSALKIAREEKRPGWQVEKELLGATHAEAGAYLLSLWGLPCSIVEAVAGHHLPADSLRPEFSALAAVHLANALEDAKHFLRSGFSEFRLNMNYPPEFRFDEQLELFGELLSTPPAADTHIFSKEERAKLDQLLLAPTIEETEDVPLQSWWLRLKPRPA